MVDLTTGTPTLRAWIRARLLPRGIWGALAYLAIVATGGLILGPVTAVPFRWMTRWSIQALAEGPRA